MRRSLAWSIVLVVVVLASSSCGMLFAPMQRRDNPLDPSSIVPGPEFFYATAAGDNRVRIKVRFIDRTDGVVPEGVRVVRNSKNPPTNMYDGEKVREYALIDIGAPVNGWYTFMDDDGSDPPATGGLQMTGRYHYAIWSYTDKGDTVVGAQYDWTDIMLPFNPVPPPYNMDNGFVDSSPADIFGGTLRVNDFMNPFARSILKFNIDDLVTEYENVNHDFYISKALLVVHTNTVGVGGEVYVSPIQQYWFAGDISSSPDPWNEFVTNPDFADFSRVQKTFVNTAATDYSFDVTEYVNEWFNGYDPPQDGAHGFLLWSAASVEVEFHSAVMSNPPRLEIDFYRDYPE